MVELGQSVEVLRGNDMGRDPRALQVFASICLTCKSLRFHGIEVRNDDSA